MPTGEKVDLYLEGSDQHRGWFHSSLLTGVGDPRPRPLQGGADARLGAGRARQAYSKSEIEKARAAGAKVDYVDPAVWMEKNGAELLRLWVAASDYQGDVVFSQTILDQLGESYRKIRNTCRFLLSNLYDFVPSRDGLADPDLREIDLLALGVLRERDHQIWDAYQRFSFHEVVRLLNDYVITVSAEYFDPIKDALYCEARGSGARRSVQTAVHEMIRTIAAGWRPCCASRRRTWPTSSTRTTGEPFDVHGAVRLVDRGEKMGNPNKRWFDEVRPRREAILQPLEAFRAAGHKPLAGARARQARARRAPALAVEPRPTSPSCWACRASSSTPPTPRARPRSRSTRRPAPSARAAGAAPARPRAPRLEPNLCRRCAEVVAALPPPPSEEPS